ncbi:MAG TPA: VWA domain-containing protein [Oscillatoriaceae cyanobacterium]
MFNFAQPAWLFALLLLPMLALMDWQRVQRMARALAAYAQEPALAKMDRHPQLRQRSVRGWLLLAALACGIVALAEPRMGLTGEQAIANQGDSLVVALDLSKSMLTRDVGGASRLETAKGLLSNLLPHLAGWRVGVVGFAGQGQALVPLTVDASAVDTLLAGAAPGAQFGRGTNIESALHTAEGLFIHPGRQVILLVTDGEELQGNANEMSGELRNHHIEIDALGLGSRDGGYVPGPPDLWGNPSYLTWHGDKVVSQLHSDLLKRLAGDTGGLYWRADAPGAEAALEARLSGNAVQASPTRQGFELFQIPLGVALLLLLIETFWGLWGRPRPEVRFADHLRAHLGPLRRPAVGVMILALGLSQTAWSFLPSWLPNREAGKAYSQGDYQRAETLLQSAERMDPRNYRLFYNEGEALYQLKRYQQSINTFEHAWELAPPEQRPMIGYNLGNALFRYAETTGDLKGYERAITEYERVLQDNPKDADARHNLEVARRRLQQAKKQQQQQSGQGKGQGQGQGQNTGATAYGQQQSYQPPPMGKLPTPAEVDAVLKALQADERQRLAQAGQNQSTDQTRNTQQNPFQSALNDLNQTKDW